MAKQESLNAAREMVLSKRWVQSVSSVTRYVD